MVYVLRGSEDGVFSVQGSYQKAYERAVQYVGCGEDISAHVPSFQDVKHQLQKYGFVCIEYTNTSCDIHRMEVE